MPWHAPSDLSTHGLTKEARALFSSFDKSNDRRVNVSNRRMALKAGLGLPESTSQLAAMSSRNEAVAARKVFDSFDFDQSGSIDAKELRPALELLQLHVSSDEASKLISRYDADSSAKLELGEFRSLCAKLRLYRQQAPPPPPSKRPQTAGARIVFGSQGQLSGDDGGTPIVTPAPTTPGGSTDASGFLSFSVRGGGGGGGSSAGGKTAFLTESALDLEVNHVRRCALGRAMRIRGTVKEVVHDHQAYREAMSRALTANQTEWALRMQCSKDLVVARGAKTSVWRPARTVVGGPMAGLPSSSHRVKKPPMSTEEAFAWADMVTNLQRKCGNR